MPHTTAFYGWKDRIHELFPALRPHHRSALAEYSFGLLLAQVCGLTTVVEYLATFLAVAAHALRQRLRELYLAADAQLGPARTTFDPTDCFGPLLLWAAGPHPKRLVLALDPTQLSDRFRVLCVAVLRHGLGVPVAWAVQPAGQKGAWNPIWFDLLGRLRLALGDGWTVFVLTDRGLESAALFREIVRLGWHPLMRVKAGGQFHPRGWHRGQRMGQFVGRVGQRWSGVGLAYPAGERLRCTLLANWQAGHEEGWCLLTDLPPGGAEAGWYGWRMWIELGFRAIKRGCWQWHRTQMTAADRVGRLWAVLAVATMYAVEVGGEGEPAQVPPVPAATAKRKLSALTLGLLWVWWRILTRQPLPTPATPQPRRASPKPPATNPREPPAVNKR